MTVYYITIFFVLLFGALAQNADLIDRKALITENKMHTYEASVFYFIASLILICVAGLRYRVGADFGAYYFRYKEYASGLITALKTIDEPGYPLISWIATIIYDDGATAIFLASLISIGLPLIVIYRNSKDLMMSMSLFVLLGFWTGSFNGVRQYLAASILFCGYGYLKNQNLLGYLIIVFIAFLFHRSAIVFVAFYFVVYQKINVKNTIIIIIVTWVLLKGYDRIFEFANWVMESEYSIENVYTARSVSILRIFVALSPMCLFLFLYRDKTKDTEVTFYLNILIVYGVLRLITMNSALLYRIGIYTSPFQAIAIAELLRRIPEYERQPIKYGMILLYGVYWWYEIYKSSSLNNFHWIWQR